MTCESCYWMRGKLPYKWRKPFEFDFSRYICSCKAGMLKTFDGKQDRTFQVGSRYKGINRNIEYETWRQAQHCMEYKSMD